MKIRYRAANGQFISKRSTQKRKRVFSELYGAKGKTVGIPVPRYMDSPKKIARAVLPKIRIPKLHLPPEIREDESDIDALDAMSFEEEWEEDFQDEFPELDKLDEITDLLEDEDEWYHDKMFYVSQRKMKQMLRGKVLKKKDVFSSLAEFWSGQKKSTKPRKPHDSRLPRKKKKNKK